MLEKIEVEKKLKDLRKMKHCNKNREEILEFLEFCGREFPDDNRIQSQRITILKRLNKLEEALEICNQFLNCVEIQSQKITILMRLNRLEEALEICEEYQNYETIQSQKITILIRLKKLEEALEICEEYQNYETIQSQRITILIKLNRLEEALEICEEYQNYETIQSQKITILVKLNRLEEALEICERFPNNELIQSQKVTVLVKLSENKSLESKLLTNIYLDRITEEEIKNSKINDYNKTILLIAYYEKNNKKKGIRIIKEKKKETLSKKELKTYNILLEKLSSNKIFNVMTYVSILKCSINFDEYSIEEKEKEENIIVTKQVIQKNIETLEPKKKKKEKKYITSTGKVVVNRNNKEKIKKISNKEEQKEILIKELFENEIIEISKQIYLELHNFERQKEAIKAWDILEEISNSSVNDKRSLEKMIRVINKIFPQNIEQNKKKYTKYLL